VSSSVHLSASDVLGDPRLLAAFAAGLDAAAVSCDVMSEGRLIVSSTEVSRLTATDVLVSAGGPEVPVAAVYIGFSGQLSGHGVLMLPALEALTLARIVVGDLSPIEGDAPSELAAGMTVLERSALEEVGNVAVSAVLNRLGDHLGVAIHPQVPVFVFDMAGAVLDAIVSAVARNDETIFAARTTFSQDGHDVTGVLLVVPSE
jgi:chemotaxis protein CheC